MSSSVPKHQIQKFVSPQWADTASRRSNSGGYSSGVGRKASGDLASLLANIENGVSPFNYQNGDVDVEAAVLLCQKAYWNFSAFRTTIDIMSEFANSPLHFIGENKASVTFYEEWYKKINGSNTGDQFFRELLRSSNVFWYRVEGDMIGYKKKSLAKIPIRYILLNPADIRASSAASFIDGSYKKVLNDFEAKRLKSSNDPRDVAIKKALPKKVREDIEKGVATSVPLDPNDIIPIFFKRQDYEPLAVPVFFPVLFDINLKQEFKKAEQIIAKACEYMILLINIGSEEHGTDEELVEATQALFQQESVGRVLVSDWSTKMEFLIPDLAKILGPEKYVAVNADIANGLMNIFHGESKYADSMVKIKVFLERLRECRKIYLAEFLIPEMERVGSALGFRDIPEPRFEDIDIKDEVEFYKIYTRLAELGILTPDETLSAFKNHLLPESYDSVASQKDLKKKKDSGLYQPIAPEKEEIDGPAGRPTGGKQKQKKKKVTPVGASVGYSVESLKDVVISANKLIDTVVEAYKAKTNIVRASKKHRDLARVVAFNIVQNEKMTDWDKSVEEYLSNPMKVGAEFEAVAGVADEHNLDFLSASLLHHSQKVEIDLV